MERNVSPNSRQAGFLRCERVAAAPSVGGVGRELNSWQGRPGGGRFSRGSVQDVGCGQAREYVL